MKAQSERLGTDPIPKLLTSLSVPAIIGMLVMALYNVVDTIFIARSVGTLGVAAVSLAFPVQMIIMALAGAIGIGGASVISRRLGAGRVEDANRVFGNVLSLVLIVSVLGLITGLIFLEELLILFGANETLLPYASDYLGIILYGTIFFTVGFSVNNIVRSEGNAKVAMLTMVIAAVINIILTPIFIFGFGWGLKGAAAATVISQGLTTFYLAYYYLSGKSTLRFKVSNLRIEWPIVKEVIAIGLSAMMHQLSSSLMFVIVNHMLIIHGGETALAIFGIIHRIIMFTIMPMLGVMQGILPIVGFNYGARQYTRVSDTIKLAFKVNFLIGCTVFALVMAFPRLWLLIFTNDPAVLETGQTALRLIFLLSMTIGIQMVTGGVFQAVGRPRAALILSMSRQVLFLIPLLLILPWIWSITGVWLAFTISDALGFLLAVVFILMNRPLFLGGRDDSSDDSGEQPDSTGDATVEPSAEGGRP